MLRRHAPVVTLFFLAPLIAEFFLGDFPIVLLPLIVALAPMYGGGALLIREVTRRTQRGWPTIVMLALAFGVFEEGVLTQSLFNPNYTDDHLLTPGFIPALGIGTLWTVFVLTLHTIWSISTPIAIVEESAFGRRLEPWLRNRGLTVVAALFVAGSVITFAINYGNSHHFMASGAQLGVSAVIAVILTVVAFTLPRVEVGVPRGDRRVPAPWLVLVAAMLAGGLFMGGLALPIWAGVAAMLIAPIAIAILVGRASTGATWGQWHRFALACGALFTYSWHAFTMGSGDTTAEVVVDLASHIIYAMGALAIAAIAVRRIRRQHPAGVRLVGEPQIATAR